LGAHPAKTPASKTTPHIARIAASITDRRAKAPGDPQAYTQLVNNCLTCRDASSEAAPPRALTRTKYLTDKGFLVLFFKKEPLASRPPRIAASCARRDSLHKRKYVACLLV
jgi:hypothetical protein